MTLATIKVFAIMYVLVVLVACLCLATYLLAKVANHPIVLGAISAILILLAGYFILEIGKYETINY